MKNTGINIKNAITEEEPDIVIMHICDLLEKVPQFKRFEDRFGHSLTAIRDLKEEYDADEVDDLLEDIYDFADDNKLGISF